MVTGATSLSLVRDELFATMDEAELSLEHFIAERENGSLLQQAVENLQQVRGTLKLIELAGAELLAQEVLQQATDIPTGAGSERDGQLSAVSNALHVLRRYLEIVDAQGKFLGEGRDLAELTARFAEASQAALAIPQQSDKPKAVEAKAFAEVAEKTQQKIAGLSMTVYPALVEEVTDAVRPFDEIARPAAVVRRAPRVSSSLASVKAGTGLRRPLLVSAVTPLGSSALTGYEASSCDKHWAISCSSCSVKKAILPPSRRPGSSSIGNW